MNDISRRLDSSNWTDYRNKLQGLRLALCKGEPMGEVLAIVSQVAANGIYFASERIEDIKDSYELMCNYLLKGYKDEHRAELYQQLVCKLDKVIGDMLMYVCSHFDASVSSYFSAVSLQDIDIDDLREKLESFVSDLAMLSLEPEEKQKELGKSIYDNHHKVLLSAFNRIVASRQWSRELGNDMANLIVSPTIDSIDSLTIVSSIMLSALLVGDAEKVLALAEIYSRATDVRLRQRALVGWVFALEATDLRLYPNVRKRLEELLSDSEVCEDLLQLQMQVIYCMNAERDNETIRKDVMPTIMNNQSLEWTRYGIREKEDDPMEDILHPDEADKKMEDMEKSIRKMVDMQKHGADIYFGGFSKMKRFGFFYTLCNWFTPFYKQHPGLSHLSDDMLNASFMDAIFKSGPFCDSDKYSFVLGLSSIYNRLPQNIREMLNNGGATMEVMGTPPDTNLTSAVYIRRQYLQDLYRFFRINDCRHAFLDPFAENSNHIFMNNEVFRPYMSVEARRMERFLMKHGRVVDASAMLANYYDDEKAEDIILKARLEMQAHHYELAEQLYKKALDMQPDEVNAQKGYALASFHAGHYDVAAEQYAQLSRKQPDKAYYKLNLAIALINDGKAEDAVRTLYELYYLDAQNMDVKRALAWGQMCLKHLDQASKLYDEILDADQKSAADYLNAGYCRWFQGNLQEAVDLFRLYIKKAGEQLHKDKHVSFMLKLNEDASLLDAYGIPQVDRRIVAGMVN